MRKFSLIFLVLFCFNLSVFSQIDSVSIQGIDCRIDTGFIKLDLAPTTFVIEEYQWQYMPYDSTNWQPLDSTSLLSDNNDTLFTTTCGKYRVVTTSLPNNNDTVIYFIPCAVTLGFGQIQPVLCNGDSNAIIFAPTFGGIVFDPDSSTFDSLGFYSPNDTTGDEYYKYQWFRHSDSITAPSVSMLIGDSTSILDSVDSRFYNVVVEDNNNCTDTLGWRFITQPNKLAIDSLIVTDIGCYSGNNGSIIISLNGGRKFQSNKNYFYYLKDTLGNILYQSDSLFTSPNFSQISTLSNSPNFLDTVRFENLSLGTYFLTALDSFGCILDTSFVITEPDQYEVFTSELSPLLCLDDSVWLYIDSVTGGQGTQNYFWSDSQNKSDSIFETEGLFNVIVEDTLFGCIDSFEVDIQVEYEIFDFVTINNVNCYGQSTGSILIDSLKTENNILTYSWFLLGGGVPQFGQDSLFENLAAGSYIINVYDSTSECEQKFYYDITQNNPLYLSPIINEPSCFGSSDGVIVLEGGGGESPYSYSLIDSTIISDSLTMLSVGSFTIIIIDNNGCRDTSTYNLSQPDSLQLSFDNFTTPLLCHDGLTPISAIISGGTGPFNFLWSNNSTSSQTVVGAGLWSCDITDDNGCSASENIIITQPDEFFISDSSSNNPLCSDGGSASIQTAGGTSPITYLWSTGETTQSISNIMSSTCWVIATDSCGNTDSVGFNLIPYDLVTFANYNDSNHLSQVIVDSLSSGTSFNYEWFFIYDSTNIVSTGAEVYNLCEGTYVVRTSDITNGCFSLDTLIVDWYLLSDIVNLEITTILPDSNLWGFGPYTYLWGPTSGFATPKANICPGDHWVEVTDRDGCKIDTFFTIDEISVNLDPANELIECDLENLDIELSVSASGGTDPYTYLWANGSTDSTINLGLNPGKLSITIMDNNACTLDTVFKIAAMTSECIPNVFTPNNDEVNDIWNLEQAFLYSNTEITIWGRFGNKVYESIGYNDPWDGKNESGNDVPDGVYFYHIELGNGYDPIKGTVTILR
jgi:gliding motility-associated-like protein